MKKFSKKTWMLLVGIVAALAFAGSALAYSSTFDPSTGYGSVAKGDLQQLLNLQNNAQAQTWFNTYGKDATFAYVAENHYQYYCQFVNGGGQTVEPVQNVKNGINASVTYSNRGQTNWAGYNLTGWSGDPEVTGDPVPADGDACTVGTNNGTVDGTPTLISSSGELTMYWDATSTVIPFTTP